MKFKHSELMERIIEAYYKVYNTLGYGFLEKVYENALLIQLEELGLKAVSQKPIQVYYHGKVVGEYFADLCVENAVIVEIKAARSISEAHKAQLDNYLKAGDIELGLLFNFGPEAEIKRRIYDR